MTYELDLTFNGQSMTFASLKKGEVLSIYGIEQY